jgi:hypothetical protein
MSHFDARGLLRVPRSVKMDSRPLSGPNSALLEPEHLLRDGRVRSTRLPRVAPTPHATFSFGNDPMGLIAWYSIWARSRRPDSRPFFGGAARRGIPGCMDSAVSVLVSARRVAEKLWECTLAAAWLDSPSPNLHRWRVISLTFPPDRVCCRCKHDSHKRKPR